MMRSADKPFIFVREEALYLCCDQEKEACVVQMRSVEEKATPFATRWLDHRQSWSLSKPGLPFATRWSDHVSWAC